MAQPQKPLKKAPPQAKKPKGNAKQVTTLFDNLNNWFSSRSSGFTILAFSLCIIFSLLLFQVRMDTGGDDSEYILRAFDFVHKGIFPNNQGPFYPIVLSPFIGIFGIRILMLKFISVIFIFFALYFFNKAFKDRIPPIVFYPVLLLTAINTYIDQFASLTYSEAFFMFLQSLAFYYFFKLYDKIKVMETIDIKETYKDFAIATLFVMLMSLSRSVGLFAFPAFLVFLIFRKQYKATLYFFGSFAGWEVVTGLLKTVVWHVSSQWGSERGALLLKNQYHPEKGYETVSGFGNRLVVNADLFLSKRFFQIIGLRSPDAVDLSPFLAFFVIALCLFAFYRAIKSKNEYIIILTFYVGVMLVCTFLALQTDNDQPRMVMVYVPLMLLMILFSIYEGFKKRAWAVQSLLIYILVALGIASLVSVFKKTGDNMVVLKKNFSGDMSYGFTPDWANYIKMSQWCADNLPANSIVATRKAEISFMYTNKEMFFPVYKTPSNNADTVLAYLKKNNVNYVMLASLRGNPAVPDPKTIITTLWKMMKPVADKYPQKLKVVHQEGDAEPAYLYQIIY